ncbi:N-acetylmuramoyl-L-alanine amidase [Alkaliphilus serpentinus]|uniref:N-acetylmuramoyl-L-alanine amidase n=1 Tax=Alkaliphilus serpentinus TaxID=1482731 RepID=A0A833HQX6_9FIRM|nr:N-acetylmuramoyl-L-alanine amidase [Alkaliphilus serpentinus]KAB3532493.1 N-acetylmuramoyl-L-alanine amidase [Alkaliphilus serpentinus]
MENNMGPALHIYIPTEDKVVTKTIEDFTKELVAWSIPIDFHLEALKCQSIIMRTSIVRKIKRYGGVSNEDIPCGDLSIEDYKGIKPLEEYEEIWRDQYQDYIKKIHKAVDETQGKIITFNGKAIDSRYHVACGGSTENSENVDGNVVFYLRRVLCRHCSESPYLLNYVDIPLEDIEKKAKVHFPNDSSDRNMEIEDILDNILRDSHGRVINLEVAGKIYEGKNFAKLLNLNSTRFSWRPKVLRFFTSGKGEGLGFCQFGAEGLAKEGKQAEEILKYYYTGIEIEKFHHTCIKFPLKGKVIVIDAGHGGDHGEDYKGTLGLREKDVNLDIAIKLKERLKELGAEVYLTRIEDRFVPLGERAQLINSIKPLFFLSIHQNYLKNSTISGTEIYYYRGDKEAEALGRLIMDSIVKAVDTIDRGMKVAEFSLLRDSRVTGLHIEVGYLSNPSDERKLSTVEFIDNLVMAMVEGISSYFNL